MEIINQQKNIYIKHLVCSLCLKWKRVFAFAFVAMALFAGVNGIRAIKYYNILGINIIFKTIIMRMIIIGFFIAIAVVMIYIIRYIFADVIKSEEEFISMCNIPVIGKAISSKEYGVIENRIKKIFGVYNSGLDEKEYVSHIIKTLEMDIITEGDIDEIAIAVVSSCQDGSVERFVNELSLAANKKIKIMYAGDITNNAKAIDTVYESEYVLLMECQSKSRYCDIERIYNRLLMWKKNPLGLVIMDVDVIF